MELNLHESSLENEQFATQSGNSVADDNLSQEAWFDETTVGWELPRKTVKILKSSKPPPKFAHATRWSDVRDDDAEYAT
eukprot:6732174-Karenia_brevis.AAC.1